MRKLFVSAITVAMAATLVACNNGEGTESTATKASTEATKESKSEESTEKNTESVKESEKETGKETEKESETVSEVNYVYNLPKDGYHVEMNRYHAGEPYQYIVTKRGNVFTEEMEYDDQKIRYDFNAQATYLDDWSGSYGWAKDETGEFFFGVSPYEELEAMGLSDFQDYFIKYFDMMGFTNEDLPRYCIGTEEIAGCNCWIIDAKGFNGICDVYWVNMENGICMKSTDENGDTDFEVTKLELD